MGRRAKKAPVQTKKRPTLAKQFKCPFCANENVVECKMDFRQGVGKLACRLCGASFQMPIHHLHEPVDVFSEWLDDCEAIAQGRQSSHAQPGHVGTDRGGGRSNGPSNGAPRGRGGGAQRDESDSEEEEDAVRAATTSKHQVPKSSSPSTSNKKQKTGDEKESSTARTTISDLGLGESDDDSDED